MNNWRKNPFNRSDKCCAPLIVNFQLSIVHSYKGLFFGNPFFLGYELGVPAFFS